MRFKASLHLVTRLRGPTRQWKPAIRWLTWGIWILAAVLPALGQAPNTWLHSLPNPAGGSKATIAISSPHLVVGESFPSNGNAYVYNLASSTPTVPVFSLSYPAPEDNDEFGFSVAIRGARVAVGCPGRGRGVVFLYDLAGVTPENPVLAFTNMHVGIKTDGLGFSMALSDRWLVAGAFQTFWAVPPRGAAHVFDLTGTTPTIPVVILTNPSPMVGSSAFGVSVAVTDSRVVVGAPHNTAAVGLSGSGFAYVYDLVSADPTLPSVVLTNPTPATSDNFGLSVAISSNRVVTGARGDDTAGFDSGIAYVYELGSATPDVPALTLTNPSPASSDHFGAAVAISGNLAAVGAPRGDTGAESAGIVYVFDLASATPTLPVATLTNPHPTQSVLMGEALAMDGATVAAARGVHVFGPGPMLNLVGSPPNAVTLSWLPTTSSGFALQYSDTLPTTNWFYTSSGETNPVTISATNSARFYRLFKP